MLDGLLFCLILCLCCAVLCGRSSPAAGLEERMASDSACCIVLCCAVYWRWIHQPPHFILRLSFLTSYLEVFALLLAYCDTVTCKKIDRSSGRERRHHSRLRSSSHGGVRVSHVFPKWWTEKTKNLVPTKFRGVVPSLSSATQPSPPDHCMVIKEQAKWEDSKMINDLRNEPKQWSDYHGYVTNIS